MHSRPGSSSGYQLSIGETRRKRYSRSLYRQTEDGEIEEVKQNGNYSLVGIQVSRQDHEENRKGNSRAECVQGWFNDEFNDRPTDERKREKDIHFQSPSIHNSARLLSNSYIGHTILEGL